MDGTCTWRTYRADKRDMQSLRLTCRAFKKLASSFLFRSLKLSYLRSDLLNFARIAYSPSLRLHVKSLHWEESASAMALRFYPYIITTNWTTVVDGREGLVKGAWERLCWNKNLEVLPEEDRSIMSPSQELPMLDGLISFLVGAINNMPNLQTIMSLPMGKKEIPQTSNLLATLLKKYVRPASFHGTDDRLFDLASDSLVAPLANWAFCRKYLNDGFFRFLLPALGRVESRPWTLKLYDEKLALGDAEIMYPSCVSRFANADLESFGNITSLGLTIPHNFMYSGSPGPDEHGRAIIQCIQSAKNLETLTLDGTADSRYTDRSLSVHFFDLLVWGEEGKPRQGAGNWCERLRTLSLKTIHYNQISLLRFLATHSRTLRSLELLGCPLEFRTIKEMSRIEDICLYHLSVTPPSRASTCRVLNDDMQSARDNEYVEPERLLAYIHTNPDRGYTSEAEKWQDMKLCGGADIPYDPSFNFYVGNDVEAGDVAHVYWLCDDIYRTAEDEDSSAEDSDEMDDYPGPLLFGRGRWERARLQGMVFDFRDVEKGFYHRQFGRFVDKDLVYVTQDMQESCDSGCDGMSPPASPLSGQKDCHEDKQCERDLGGEIPEGLKNASEALSLALPGYDSEKIWEGMAKPTVEKAPWELSDDVYDSDCHTDEESDASGDWSAW